MDRKIVPKTDQWNTGALYASVEDWEKDFTLWGGQKKEPHWPKLAQFRLRLKEGLSVVVELLNYYFEVERHLHKLYTYAHLKHDEDVGDESHKAIFSRITTLLNTFQKEASWIQPELLQFSDQKLEQFLNAEELVSFKFYLKKIIRQKPHTLSADQEKLITSAALALDSMERAFGAFNNGDLKFPSVLDSQGKSHELTHGKYSVYLKNYDRVLRKNSFKTFHQSYGQWENTLSELLQGELLKHRFNMESRKFSSCLEAALFPHNIDVKMYTNLTSTVRQHIKVLHRYMSFRKEILQLDELRLYDMHVSLIPETEITMEFDAAVRLVVDSVAHLGPAYQMELEKGLLKDQWVDRYENNNKRSGAYSSGCYGNFPYILMNYQKHFGDVMTLAHEAGHSMHSLLAWKSQSYHDSNYPIFLAEIASTFNEQLLHRHLMATLTDPQQKAYLINQQIENIRNTFFRQVMFAEFELEIHLRVERGIPLTPALLKGLYHQLNVDYFGPSVALDVEGDMEWARVPHFYYNFYVYQYATGLSAAHALLELTLKNGPHDYLRMLSSGGSSFPINLIEEAGVDMYAPKTIESTITLFSQSVEELKTFFVSMPK